MLSIYLRFAVDVVRLSRFFYFVFRFHTILLTVTNQLVAILVVVVTRTLFNSVLLLLFLLLFLLLVPLSTWEQNFYTNCLTLFTFGVNCLRVYRSGVLLTQNWFVFFHNIYESSRCRRSNSISHSVQVCLCLALPLFRCACVHMCICVSILCVCVCVLDLVYYLITCADAHRLARKHICFLQNLMQIE